MLVGLIPGLAGGQQTPDSEKANISSWWEFPSAQAGKPFLSINNLMLRKMFPGRLPELNNLEFGLELGSTRVSEDGRSYDKRLYFDFRPTILGDAYRNLYLEMHGERRFHTLPGGRRNYSIGWGYRRISFESLLFGVNAFTDVTVTRKHLDASWGWGLEMAYTPLDRRMVDFRLNSYGNPFGPEASRERNLGPHKASWEMEVGYTDFGLLDACNLRLRAGTYGTGDLLGTISGRKIGLDLTIPADWASVSYEFGRDGGMRDFHNFRAGVRMDFQPDLILDKKNPFLLPSGKPVGYRLGLLKDYLVSEAHRRGIGKRFWQ